MPVLLVVEPSHSGHRFARVADVVAYARPTHDVVVLTSIGASATDAFRVHLTNSPATVVERFDSIEPPTRQLVRGIEEQCRSRPVDSVVVMDADRALIRWWYAAPRAFRHLPYRPRVIFMLTRYPTRIGPTDWVGWKLRLSKGALSLLAMATRTLDRVAGFSGRDDMAHGWLVKKTGDPATCAYTVKDRTRLRDELGLPLDRQLVGICGVVGERKNAPFVLEAILAGRLDADLVLAGEVKPEVARWLERLPEDQRARIIVRAGFLSNDMLDRYVASVDAIALPLTNNGPSGVMGIALAAGVPVVTAGSRVRAREIMATAGGETADFTVESFALGLRRALARDATAARRGTVPLSTPETFAAALLGDRY